MEGLVEKVFVVKRVAEKLWSTEEAIDGAIAEAAALMGGLVEARRELNVSPVATDKATSRIAEAMAAMAEARAALMAAHQELNEVKLRIGVRTKLDGAVKPIHSFAQGDEVERQAG
jgi:hypothetical protein